MTPAHHLTVRPATFEDLETLTEFSAAMALETEQRTLDRTRLRMGTQAVIGQPERGRYFVADLRQGTQADTVTVGQLLITYEWSDWRNAQFWWIQSVYVHPAWRRQGVYRRMHLALIEMAQARPDVCGVRLYVEGSNHVAKHVYKRVGLCPSTYEVYESDFVLPHDRSHHNIP
jgi:ribosomal protein S18 acetylase RimI-like enzyme